MSFTPHPNTIVLVEDIDTITKLFSIILRKANLDVRSFTTGEDACEWLANNKPALVLCDIMLPGMDGIAVLQFIRSLPFGNDIRAIAVTALAMEGDRERLIAAGFDDYIPKPINSATFVSQIRQHLNQ
jgi:CheY-like chemotaxis protein